MSIESTLLDPWHPAAFDRLLHGAERASSAEDSWHFLEAAHIVGQMRFVPHLTVHALMLKRAWHERAIHEVLGQAFRLSLVPLGHLLQRLPRGNTGRSHVSAFQSMPIRPELQELIARASAGGLP